MPEVPFRPAKWPFFYGWTVAGVGTLAMIATAPGQTMGVGVFNEPMMQALGLDRVQMSVAYLVGTLISGFLMPQAGRMIDRVGVRRAMTWTCVWFGVALCGMSQVDAVAGWLGGVLGTGLGVASGMAVLIPGFFVIRFLGQGLLSVCSNTMRAKWFNRWRGTMLAGCGVFTSLAFSMVPLAFNGLIEQFGWRGGWLVLGGFLLVVMAPLSWLLARDNPEECGLVMDGRDWDGEPVSKNLDLLMRREFSVGEAVRTYAFWVLTAVLAWHSFFATGFLFHIEDIARAAGVPKTTLMALFVPAAPVVISVSLLSGWLVDRTRLKYFGTVMALGSGLMAFGLYRVPAAGGEWWVVAGMGLAGGCYGLMINNTNPRFFGRLHLGAINGLTSSVIVLSSALGPAVFSLIKVTTGGYRAAFVVGVVVGVMLALAATRADNPQRKIGDEVA
ncbi:MAG: MFS transporter [Verrucomicrobiales bacterium]